ncbi:MAG: hypothetical protein JSU63_05715 [Phycisphaerales bacterium]|nr:MAG: hypothetical protein JSU63_05715 [Phycisphaerales bacterium]
MFQRFRTLALNTFVETVRQPIYGVILLATAVLLVLNVSLAAFTLDDDDKLLLDLGLSTLLLSGLFLSVFSAAEVLHREIVNKTVLTVVSKPISRPVFILGKFTGILGAILVAYYLCFLVFILALRHGVLQSSSDPWDGPVLVFGLGSLLLSLVGAAFANYFYGKDFPTTWIGLLAPMLTLGVLLVGKFDEEWAVIPFASNFVGGQVILAAYLVLLMVILTGAVAMAASTRFGHLMTLAICTGVLGLGIAADYAFGQYEATSLAAAVAYRALPNMGPFWVIDGLYADAIETAIPFRYVLYVTCYASLLTVAVLGIAIAAFQRREVG